MKLFSLFNQGDDYYKALKAAFYFRDCTKNKLIRKLVTFHFFFPSDHLPQNGTLKQV